MQTAILHSVQFTISSVERREYTLQEQNLNLQQCILVQRKVPYDRQSVHLEACTSSVTKVVFTQNIYIVIVGKIVYIKSMYTISSNVLVHNQAMYTHFN